MSSKNNVSISVIRRLPRYYRFLGELINSGCTRISSRELSEKMGLTASQIRQDLNCFGGFGQQGYGYNVISLRDEISKILGLDKSLKAILIGVGNLGKAVTAHVDFPQRGFELQALFDNNPNIIGSNINSYTVLNINVLEDFCKKNKTEVALLCIPKEVAQSLSETLIKCGIRNFWNFSHYDFTLEYRDVIVENVHLSDSLLTLCYRVNEKNTASSNNLNQTTHFRKI